ncbi:hypothetical protein [Marilutibacter alkalisoli]|uniref:Uncharacterized protein n=1 Tax=Marilutibacter alkalisoli TaxID=2591633 RepID=A0A514BP52_9GAMM|nr:hypothetical protein [Lysobacter alkalisoli]QDH69115.1 hypothetical protein FKV23_02595 [Lysobacter alkalisoli]
MKTMMFSAVLLVIVSTPSLAQSSAEGQAIDPVEQEAKERELAYQLAPIKSDMDLRTYLARNRSKDSPLNLLSPGARQRFIQSLVFTNKGLASFDYRDIQIELNATQTYQLLSLFGVQRSTRAIPNLEATTASDMTVMGGGVISLPPDDYPGYECEKAATCRESHGAICIGSNC